MFTVEVEDFKHWRNTTRALLRRQVSPKDIHWQASSQQGFCFGENHGWKELPIKIEQPRIPKDFLSLAEKVACFRCDTRWALLYSLVWRLVFEDKTLLSDSLDPQVRAAYAMRKAVLRDRHKLEAFLRFKPLAISKIPEADAFFNGINEYFVAWFEPQHLILPISMDFFVRRFHNMGWSILTPDGCAHWNGKELHFFDELPQKPEIEDEVEELWLTFYRHIFNPARLKLKAMQTEMPKKYWRNLPEAPLIKELTRSAGDKTDQMIEQAPNPVWSKTEKSKRIKSQQQQLRTRAFTAQP